MIMTGTRMQIDAALRNAYRATFQEYARKLETLQALMDGGLMSSGTADTAGSLGAANVDAALIEVEQARIAHNAARDRLAKELVRPPLPSATGNKEHHIRETARLLWEMAGRPDGTAERDWRRAEQLVQRAAASSCC